MEQEGNLETCVPVGHWQAGPFIVACGAQPLPEFLLRSIPHPMQDWTPGATLPCPTNPFPHPRC